MARRLLSFLMTCMLVHLVLSDLENGMEIELEADDVQIPLPVAIKAEDELIRNIIDTYRKILDSQKLTESDTAMNKGQYKVLKRNADIINTLLGFPRRMLVAGR